MEILPLFKSHFSIGRSILTFDAPNENTDWSKEPDSILNLAKKAGLKSVVVVENTMGGVIEAERAAEEAGLSLYFGLILPCSHLDEYDESAIHNNVIFPKNKEGYERLCQIHTVTFWNNSENNPPFISYKQLGELWDNEDLKLSVPFYDSYIYKNAMGFNKCINDFSFLDKKPIYFVEDNDLPEDFIIQRKINSLNVDTLNTQTILYGGKDDFKSWQTTKIMHNRQMIMNPSIEKPELEGCGSYRFSFENFLEKRNAA